MESESETSLSPPPRQASQLPQLSHLSHKQGTGIHFLERISCLILQSLSNIKIEINGSFQHFLVYLRHQMDVSKSEGLNLKREEKL